MTLEQTDQPPAPNAALPAHAVLQRQIDEVLARVLRRREDQRLPQATYRIQLHSQCTFREAESLVPFLNQLGISDCYASPFLRAQPASRHGYDIVSHGEINPEIGTLNELRSLRSALASCGMGLIADVVPNHMSNSPQLNLWWRDVLENGPSSPYAIFFDIDWMPLKTDLAFKVLLPVLGAQFGKVLEDGQLVVRYGAGAFWLEYFDHSFPLAPRSYATILSPQLPALRDILTETHPDLQEMLSILTSIRNLPPQTETREELLEERRREKEVVKRRLHDLVSRSAEVARFVESCVATINGQVGDPRSFDRLDGLLREQAYRLADWRVAADEINYRRFFDINELAAICTEHPTVFTETHRLLLQLVEEGTITGLRIDHPDGLYDPHGYLRQLQEQYFLQRCRQELATVAGDTSEQGLDQATDRLGKIWRETTRIPGTPLADLLYVVVEKILAGGESLPDNWPVRGTVGYEFLNQVNGLFVAKRGENSLSSLYERMTRTSHDFATIAYQAKRLIAKSSMGSEIQVLGHRLDRISEGNRWTRDFTLPSLTRALQEVMACFRVYRTYVSPEQILERDSRYVREAVAQAKRQNPTMSESVFDFVEQVLLLKYHDNADAEEKVAVQRFTGKFQQLTGPIMAKAVEDTAFYRYNRLVSLNEVGGDPTRFGTTVAEFHEFNLARLPRFPHGWSATSTHDTKRGEDVRARIHVLSEIGRPWRERVRRWTRWHQRYKSVVDGREAPSRNSQYHLYQTLVGIWPPTMPRNEDLAPFVARVQRYMLKVVREAKVNTSWIRPHREYELALERFVANILREDLRRPFLQELAEFAGGVAEHGYWNSLSQVALKICSPGVPDFYQGTETWSYTLVDPDNRQSIAWTSQRTRLASLQREMADAIGTDSIDNIASIWLRPGASPTDFLNRLLADRSNGNIKLFTTLIALHARRQWGDHFASSDYRPLVTSGKFANHVVAFARHQGGRTAIVIAPRLTVAVAGFGGPPPLGDAWEDTVVHIPASWIVRRWHNAYTRDTLKPTGTEWLVSDLLQRFPVALLLRDDHRAHTTNDGDIAKMLVCTY